MSEENVCFRKLQFGRQQVNSVLRREWMEQGAVKTWTRELPGIIVAKTCKISDITYRHQSTALRYEGLDGGYKCQLSVKISVICQLPVKFSAFCQLSVKWLLMINYETYVNIFDAKFGLKGTYNVN